MSNLEELADQVLAIDNSKSRADILVDLEYTKSAEATINRIFDDQFLHSTKRDPSIQKPFIILDSDEEDIDILHSPTPILLEDSIDIQPAETSKNSFQVDNDLDSFSIDNIDLCSDSASPPHVEPVQNQLQIVDSDSDDLVSLPSKSDFFDELMSQQRPKPVVEVDEMDDDISIESQDKQVESQTSTQLTAKERKKIEVEERKRKRAEEAEEKKRQKARLVEEKKRLKEQKEFEKQRTALFERENRIRNDRAKVIMEMIVDIHPEFLKTRSGLLVDAILSRKEVEMSDLLLQQPNPKHTISWRRKCISEWNNDSQAFIPLSAPKIANELVVLVHAYTQDFVQYIQNNTVDQYIDGIQRANPDRQIMLMLEGLENYYRKKKVLQRRQFDVQVRNSIQSSSSTQRPKRRDEIEDLANAPDQTQVEECLNYLQIVRDIMLVPTKDEEDTASWIESLTTDLALKRYKIRNINNSYKVSKSGTDPHDTFLKMLQEVQLCTPAIAKSIISSYPTLQSLSKAYDSKNKSDGELLLADLEVERSTLHSRDRKVNRVMSKKMYTIFNSDDPEQTIY